MTTVSNLGVTMHQAEISTICLECGEPGLFGHPVYSELFVTRTSDSCDHVRVTPKIVKVQTRHATVFTF